jgi:hypothetical protein
MVGISKARAAPMTATSAKIACSVIAPVAERSARAAAAAPSTPRQQAMMRRRS